MNGKEYKNVINWTLSHREGKSDDKLEAVREVFTNMGVSLPHGNVKEISETLKNDDYMGWRSCTAKEAQKMADDAVTSIGIDGEKIIIITPNVESNDVCILQNDDFSDILMVVDEQNADMLSNDIQFYANINDTTTEDVGGGSGDTGKTYRNILIYRSRNRERLGFAEPSSKDDVTPITHEDLTYGKKSTYEIYNNGSLIGFNDLYSQGVTTQHTIAYRRQIITNFFDSQTKNDKTYTPVLYDMLDHFIEGSGYDYYNAKLTNAVQYHSETQSFVNKAIVLIKECISECKGNIEALRYDENLWTNPTKREQHPIVKKMLAKDDKDRKPLLFPLYGYDNEIPALALAIDTLYGGKIEIVSLQLNGNSYHGVLKFNFYDHFGLDTTDLSLKKYGGMKAGYIPAFRQWYILQHWKDLNVSVHPKPFVTQISFNVSFSGKI